MTDYTDTRHALQDAHSAIRDAGLACGRVNMPGSMAPASVARQIVAVEADLHRALAECARAKEAAAKAGRRGLVAV